MHPLDTDYIKEKRYHRKVNRHEWKKDINSTSDKLSKKEVKKWKVDYEKWVDDNSQ